MSLDSVTVSNLGAIAALNPSWSLVILALIVTIGFVIHMLNRNTNLTADSNSKSASMLDTINEIRSDQIISNHERRVQANRLDDIEQVQSKMLKRLDSVEDDIDDIKQKSRDGIIRAE